MAKEFSKKFYASKVWKDCRNQYASSVGGLCEKCALEGLEVKGDEVHHKIELTPSNINDPNISLAWTNLQLLCFKCHQAIRYGSTGVTAEGLKFDSNGDIVRTEQKTERRKDAKVKIIYGCAGSGKSTYVLERFKRGDVIIDLDVIGQAISGQEKTNLPIDLLPTVLSVREHLFALVEYKQIKAETIWIVAGLPNKKEREVLKDRLKAEIVYIDATKEECIERIMGDDNRKDKAKQRMIIQKWFKDYER